MKKKLLFRFLSFIIIASYAIIFVSCTKVQFRLSFIVDDKVYATIDTSGDEVIKLPDDPKKENYIFDGWYWDRDIWQSPFTANSLLDEPISSDMSVYAKWIEEDLTKRNYTVSFNSFGGSVISNVTVQYGKLLSEPEEPTKTGYVFAGWFLDADLQIKWNFATDIVTEDIILYAKWVDESDATGCNIISAVGFDVEGNNLYIEVPNSQENFALSEVITVSPYARWTVTLDITGNTEIPSGTIPLEVGDNIYYINVISGNGSNKKQYSVEIRRRELYTVIYQFDNGDKEVIELVEEDSKATFKSAERKGYTFVDWCYNNETWDFEKDIVVNDMTLIAKWTANEYQVNFNSTGGSAIDSATVTYDDSFKFPIPSRDGYEFLGWVTEDGIQITDHKGDSIVVWNMESDVTLYAEWSIIDYTITYENIDGATNSNPLSYTITDGVINLIDAQKSGYAFLGWYADESFTTKVEKIDTSLVSDVVLWAKWQAIEYTAVFQNSDGIVDTITFTIEDETISEPSVPVRNGYVGVWEKYEIIPSDLVINAIYEPITYTITYTNTKGAENKNETQFTIESETIVLLNLYANGYNFVGWFYDEEKVTEIVKGTHSDINLEARWSLVEYTITYEYDDMIGGLLDGTTLKTTYTIEDSFTFSVLESYTTGYNFAGWFTEKEVGMGEKVTGINAGTIGDKIIYAQWGLEIYSINYVNAEDAINTNPTNYTIESQTFVIADISKAGYHFEGWYSDAEFNTLAKTTVSTGSYGDLTLYAKWSLVSYTIKYNLYGGTYDGIGNPESYNVEMNIELVNPKLTGSFFVGWYTQSEGGVLKTEISQGTIGNITLYARWITFESNGGSEIDYDLNYSESGITPPDSPRKDYYNFAGWYFDTKFNDAYDFNTLPQKTCILYAKWIPVEYTINYVLNGGINNENNPQTYNIEDFITFYAPIKTGYTFNGWYTNEQFTGELVDGIKLGSHGEITLYASFSINKYTINFETNGGTTISEITANYGATVVAPKNPSKNGYRFAGWYLESELKTPYIFTTIPAEDITLYAKWELAEYKIFYNLDGGVNALTNPKTYNIESGEIIFAKPSKLGYEFSGWYIDIDYKKEIVSLPTGSYGEIEIFAKWNIIEYEIEFVTPEGAEHRNPLKYTVETELLELVGATLRGHTFVGWYLDTNYTEVITTLGGGSVGNLIIYSKFIANDYDIWMDGSDNATAVVSFDLNGASGTVPDTQIITEAIPLIYPKVPVRIGYVFGGWYTSRECVGNPYDFAGIIAGNITLYAKWVKVESNKNGININDSITLDLNGTTEKRYVFVPLVSGNVSILSSGSIDTFGSLYKNGKLLKQDDDSASDGKNFLIVYNVTAGETYEIGLRGFSTSSNGVVTLTITGTCEVNDGGYAQTGSKVTVTYGSNFILPVPKGDELQKFLGWQDENGLMYTDEEGVSIRVWDRDTSTVLFSKWEYMEYTITFDTSGGSPIDSVKFEYGERIDINKYVTTRDGYTFVGWYLDGEEYNASTMPNHNITLTARWKTFALGTIKYDIDKKAISVDDEITAELFGAFCIDTNGNYAKFTISINGTQTVGNVITVRLTATSEDKIKVVTITDIKVYGTPTINVENIDKNYINPDEFTAEAWGASGTDTFGNPTEIVVRIDEDYGPGSVTTVYIDSIDMAGNVTTYEIKNVSVYDLPTISYNEEKVNISVNDSLDSSLFEASAVDSFNESLDITVELLEGYLQAGDTVKIRLTATDSKGNKRIVEIVCKVYGNPVISDPVKTDFNVNEVISVETLGLLAIDTYGNYLEIKLSGTTNNALPGKSLQYTVVICDVAGNIVSKEFTIYIYGEPTISYNRTNITIDEANNMNLNSDFNLEDNLGIIAKDSFGKKLNVNIEYKSGIISGGNTVVYQLVANDHLGNVSILDVPFKIYNAQDIDLSYSTYATDLIKITSKGEEFFASAIDSFGEPCVIHIEAAEGFVFAGGNVISLYILAEDVAGNIVKSELISNIKVYDTPTIEFIGGNDYTISPSENIDFLFVGRDSFGEELVPQIIIEGELVPGANVYITVTVSDVLGNEFTKTYEFFVANESDETLELYVNNILVKTTFVPEFGEYLPIPENSVENPFLGWKHNTQLYTDETGKVIKPMIGISRLDAVFEYKIISNANDLKNINLDGKYILMSDINLNDIEWTPLGTKESPFSGVFLGNGHTISHFSITKKVVNTGLFGYVTGEIYDLNVTDFSINLTNAEDGYIGGLAGYVKGGTITDCVANGTIIIEDTYEASRTEVCVGGLIGYLANGTITDCLTNVSINMKTRIEENYVGGLIGYSNNSLVRNCNASSNVETFVNSGSTVIKSYIGGLIGYCTGIEEKITSNTSETVIDSTVRSNGVSNSNYAYVGGLVGYNEGVIIEQNYSKNNIKSTTLGYRNTTNYVGGILGYNIEGKVLSCYSTSTIGSDMTSYRDYPALAYVGGVVGYNDEGSSILDSYANVEVIAIAKAKNDNSVSSNTSSSATIYVGGLVGYNSLECLIEDSYSIGGKVEANVEATSRFGSGKGTGYAGGLVAYNKGIIRGCYSSNEVVATTKCEGVYNVSTNVYSYAGGLVANNGVDGVIENCFASGNVKSECEYRGTSSSQSTSYVGGLVGENSGIISITYATGNVTNKNSSYGSGKSYSGGLVGYNSKEIKNSFAMGNVESTYSFSSSSTLLSYYVGGLVGYNSKNEQIVSCYRYEGQNFELTYEKNLNDLGVAQTMDSLSSFIFQIEMGFESEIWKMVNGQLPILRISK